MKIALDTGTTFTKIKTDKKEEKIRTAFHNLDQKGFEKESDFDTGRYIGEEAIKIAGDSCIFPIDNGKINFRQFAPFFEEVLKRHEAHEAFGNIVLATTVPIELSEDKAYMHMMKSFFDQYTETTQIFKQGIGTLFNLDKTEGITESCGGGTRERMACMNVDGKVRVLKELCGTDDKATDWVIHELLKPALDVHFKKKVPYELCLQILIDRSYPEVMGFEIDDKVRDIVETALVRGCDVFIRDIKEIKRREILQSFPNVRENYVYWGGFSTLQIATMTTGQFIAEQTGVLLPKDPFMCDVQGLYKFLKEDD